MMKSIHCIFVVLALSGGAIARAEAPPLIGKLGRAVGTTITVEGKLGQSMGDFFRITNVDGAELAKPVWIGVAGLAQPIDVTTDTLCRFRGVETTYVVEPVLDPKTGEHLQQQIAGRHFLFKVTEVLAPGGLKLKEQR